MESVLAYLGSSFHFIVPKNFNLNKDYTEQGEAILGNFFIQKSPVDFHQASLPFPPKSPISCSFQRV